jgi:hypothetical protein
MTVTTTLVAAVSRGLIVVSDSGAFTTEYYNLIKPDAKSLLDQNVGSGNLPTNIYDRCWALMICHLWITGDPAFGFSSYSAGDYSQSLKEPGDSVYSLQVKAAIAQWNQQGTPQAQSGVRRADCDMGLMQTDPQQVQEPWADGSSVKTNPWGIMGPGI